jgi:hypothetical protein
MRTQEQKKRIKLPVLRLQRPTSVNRKKLMIIIVIINSWDATETRDATKTIIEK